MSEFGSILAEWFGQSVVGAIFRPLGARLGCLCLCLCRWSGRLFLILCYWAGRGVRFLRAPFGGS